MWDSSLRRTFSSSITSSTSIACFVGSWWEIIQLTFWLIWNIVINHNIRSKSYIYRIFKEFLYDFMETVENFLSFWAIDVFYLYSLGEYIILGFWIIHRNPDLLFVKLDIPVQNSASLKEHLLLIELSFQLLVYSFLPSVWFLKIRQINLVLWISKSASVKWREAVIV